MVYTIAHMDAADWGHGVLLYSVLGFRVLNINRINRRGNYEKGISTDNGDLAVYIPRHAARQVQNPRSLY